MPDALPIYEIEDEIITALRSLPRLIVQAPTGSGKSTQVPQMLRKHGLLGGGQVVILQPRRLAARLLASRVAQELGVALGEEVGYQIRFENATSRGTRIKFETEGILLRQMLQDSALTGIQALIFDEFHERHLYGDITLARALDIQEQSRPDLLIVAMSATLDAGMLRKYLDPCAAVTSEGRTFPVIIEYLPRRLGSSAPPVWELAADAFARYAKHAPSPGARDVLVFMPGGYEIHRTIDAIRSRPESRGYLLLPLHGELSSRDQDAAVGRYDRPKVVVATNVAETSITIDGIHLVIDSGLARIPRYDPNRGINTLLIEKISRASAEQRAGRAGRTAPGHCIRLWSEPEHAERPAQELSEIRRLDISEVILTLKAAGIEDLRTFRWLEPPADAALAHAEELLLDLGALEPAQAGTAITPLGRSMLGFPLHPRYSRMLIAAQEYQCVHEACLLAALTQGRDLLVRNPDRQAAAAREELFIGGFDAASDFGLLMRAWEYASRSQFRMDALRGAGINGIAARQVGPLHEQFLRIAKEQGLDVQRHESPDEALRKCILIGFSDRVARRLDQGSLRCELVHGRRGALTRESVVRDSELLVAAEVQELGGAHSSPDVKTVLSLATAIEAAWLREIFPHDIRSEMRVVLDPVSRRVSADDVERFRDLAIAAKRVEPPPEEAAARVLADEVVSGRLPLPNWDHGVEQWILRLNLLAQWCPEFQLSPVGDEDRRHIIEQLCLGAVSYKEVKDRDVRPAVKSWISANQRELLDKYAPERVTVSNGRTPKVTYEAQGPPYISLRIQELFGVTETPKIAMGRIALSVHILAPSMRPVQVTRDLANFWREHYPRIKQELQRKYPKHEWR